jgi:hypothetical protein
MENSDYIAIVAIVFNFIAIFIAAYLGIKYFVRQQKILRLEKHFYYDGILKSEEVLLCESSKLDTVYNFIIFNLDNLPTRIKEKTVDMGEVEEILSGLKVSLQKLTDESLNFNPALNITSDLIKEASGKSFLSDWVRSYENNKKSYVIEARRLLDAIRHINALNIDGKRDAELVTLTMTHSKALADTFYILWSLNTLSVVFSLLRKEFVDASVSQQKDVLKIMLSEDGKGWTEAFESMFSEQSKLYETKDALYPLRTIKHNICLKKIPAQIEGFVGTFPTFSIEKTHTQFDPNGKDARLFTYAELQSLVCACFDNGDINKPVNFVKDYLNVSTSKMITHDQE